MTTTTTTTNYILRRCVFSRTSHYPARGHIPHLVGGHFQNIFNTHPRLPATQLREDIISWRGGSRSYRSTNMGPAKTQTKEKHRGTTNATGNRHAKKLLESFLNCVCIRRALHTERKEQPGEHWSSQNPDQLRAARSNRT